MRAPLSGQRAPGPGAGSTVVEPALHQKKLSQRQLGGPRALLVKATTNTTCVIILPPAPCQPLSHFLELGYTPVGPCPGQGQGPTRKKKKVGSRPWESPSGSDGQESACQGRRPRFNPWVRNIPWRWAWQPTPAFLPGESHGQRRLAGYSPWVTKSWTRLTKQQALGLDPVEPDPTPKTTQARGSSYVLRLRTRREGPQKSRREGGQEPASSCPSWLRTSLLKFIRKTHFFLSHCCEGLPHLSRRLWAHTLDGGRARAQLSSTQSPDRRPGHVSALNQPLDFQPEGREADVLAEPRRAPCDLDRFALTTRLGNPREFPRRQQLATGAAGAMQHVSPKETTWKR